MYIIIICDDKIFYVTGVVPVVEVDNDITADDDVAADGSITPAPMLGKRKRTKPSRLADYTDPSTKRLCLAGKSLKFNPLKAADKDDAVKFKSWLVGLINNTEPRDVKTGDATPHWFTQLLTPQFWLTDAVNFIDLQSYLSNYAYLINL